LFDVRLCKNLFTDPARDNRKYKILPHRFFPNYEYSLYVDGSVIIQVNDIRGLVEKYLHDHSWAVYSHPERDCIYDEARVCTEAGKDGREIIEKQIEKYKKEGYPAHSGLTENSILLRRHNASDTVSLSEAWWLEFEQFSRRDQLSFNYVAWKQNFCYALIDGFLWDNENFKYNNEHFKIKPHKCSIGLNKFEKPYSAFPLKN